MTPEEFNTIAQRLANKLDGDLITPADSSGTAPEIAVNFEGVDLLITLDVV